jgi:hypothetical protein
LFWHHKATKKTIETQDKTLKQSINIEPFGQGTRSPQENPRYSYEASGQPERPSILDRGSSTTKTCQAVPTREYQSDLPSLHAPRVLSKGFKQKSDNIKLITSIDRLIHIRSLSDLGNRSEGKSF